MWGSSSQPQGQELHTPLIVPARYLQAGLSKFLDQVLYYKGLANQVGEKKAPLFSSSRPDVSPGYARVCLLWKMQFWFPEQYVFSPELQSRPRSHSIQAGNKCEYH